MKMKVIASCIILACGMVGVSYASWNNNFVYDTKVSTGKIVLDNESNMSSSTFSIDLNLPNEEILIPFSITNNSTIPIKMKNTTLTLNGENVDSIGTITFNYDNIGIITGDLLIDLISLDEIFDQNISNSISITNSTQILSLEIEFVQINSEDSWNEKFNFDIEIIKNDPIEPELPVIEVPIPEIEGEEIQNNENTLDPVEEEKLPTNDEDSNNSENSSTDDEDLNDSENLSTDDETLNDSENLSTDDGNPSDDNLIKDDTIPSLDENNELSNSKDKENLNSNENEKKPDDETSNEIKSNDDDFSDDLENEKDNSVDTIES